MKKAMKQLFQKGISGILCVAMLLTSLSIPEMTAYASQTELTDEMEAADKTNDVITDESDIQDADSETAKESEDIPETDNKDQNSDLDADKDDANSEVGGGDSADDTADSPGEAAPKADEDVMGVAAMDLDTGEDEGLGDDNDAGEPEGVQNLLQNGNFEAEVNDDSGWYPPDWTVDSAWAGNFKANREESDLDAKNGNYVSWYMDENSESTNISISQTISNVEQGIYMISADVAGVHPAKQFSLKVSAETVGEDEQPKSIELTSIEIDEGTGWSAWETVNSVFEISEANAGDIKVCVEGSIGAAEAQSFILDNVELTLAVPKLQALYDEADAVKKDDKEYTTDSLATLTTAMEAAEGVIKNTDAIVKDIKDAYTALKTALDNLEENKEDKDVEVTFYYYAGDIGKNEVGVYHWRTNKNITSEADDAKWTVWQGDSVWKMEPTEYLGWYTIDFKLSGSATDDSNFEIFTQDNNQKSVFKCFSQNSEGEDRDNTDIYNKLFSKEASEYAVKDGKCYVGKELVTAAMRSVTLYVYSDSETDAPALMKENGTLSKIEEDDNGIIKLSELTADDYDDSYENNNHYYSMTKDTNNSNWYYLTFSVPDMENASDKICNLYLKADKDAWAKNFLNGPTSDKDSADFTQVFDGKVYYKDGEFYKSADLETDVITLKMLKDLLEIEDVTAIIDKTSDSYTGDSWKAFNDALTQAQEVVAACDESDETKVDTYESEEITDAYNALVAAVSGMEDISGKNVVKFYYYDENNKIGDGDEVGLTFFSGGSDNSYSSAETCTWSKYNNEKNYKMTSVAGCAGWYSIPIIFVEGGSWPGFDIYKKGSGADIESVETLKINSINENKVITDYGNYPQLPNNTTAFAYKDKKYYYGEVKSLLNILNRYVTLHVYSEEGTPAIGVKGTLSTMDEETRKVETITESDSNDTDNINYYNMTADADNDGWYSLNFFAPLPEENAHEICGLYTYSGTEYTPTKIFIDEKPTDTDLDSVDFTQAIDGKTYYKDGEFYDSKESAELVGGITFGALKTLVEAANKLVQSEYTEESWNEFSKALKTASELVTQLTDESKDDTYKDEGDSTEIADAYNNLDEAKNALEKKDRIINFSYYAGDTDGKGVGVYKFGPAISPKADQTSWDFWGSKIYEMTATDYFGWYTIPLTFTGSIDDENNKSNFQIGIEGSDSAVLICGNTNDVKSKNEYFDIYEELFSGTDTSYAVKKVGDSFKLFKGDAADAVMRNVTLHIYSESGVPAIVLNSGKKLTYIDESAGTEKDLEGGTETTIGEWAVNCYDMKADETVKWYSLSFIVPTPDNDGKFFDLAIKDAENATYTWNAKFMSADSASADAPNFKSAVKDGKTYYKDGIFYKSLDDVKEITLEDLKKLIETTKELKSEDYTEASWTVFDTALKAANEVVKKYDDESFEGTVDSEEIKGAYDSLAAAIKDLKEKGNTITFNYYAGNTDGKGVAVYYWSEKDGISTTAAPASWKAWNDTTTLYSMTPAQYSGWYTIDLTFAGNATDSANIQIFTEADKGNPVFQCGSTGNKDNGGNDAIYNKIFAAADSTYAVQKFGNIYKLYEGEDDVKDAMRNVTLYVYSTEGTPAIMSNTELNYIDESDGSKKKLTADDSNNGTGDDGTPWYNYFYNMKPVTDKQNWYELTFIAPDKENASDKICELYIGSDWKMNFLNGPVASGQEKWNVDFTSVFSGNACYNNGQFYSSMDLAEGITLKMLEDLVTSDKITAIVNKGAAGYTAESWTTFDTAYKAADDLVKACRADDDTKSDDYKSDDIKDKYTELSTAADAIVPVVQESVVTLYYYSEDLNEYTDTDTEKYNLYLSTWNNTKISSTKDEVDLAQSWGNYKAYEFEKVTDENINKGFDNWYTVPVKVLAANDGTDGDGFLIQLGKAITQDETITHQALVSDAALIKITYWDNSTIYAAIANAGNGGVIAIKDGKMYSSIENAEKNIEVTLEDLKELYNEAVALQKTDYRDDDNWTKFQTALKSAKAILDKDDEATDDEILEAYNSLEASMKALVYITSASIAVKKVPLADDFITGADLSSYVSLKQSGVVFKDENGKALSDSEFFKYLKDGGTNWVRIRVWNDPYNSNGDGYGGGNSDLDKAKIIGKLATDAGMRVLIDFHYSDFWADPSKQDAPKAWEGYSLEQKEKAVYDYTLDSLNALKAAGVDVGMVQVGNETNNGICGEKVWDNMVKIFSAGSKAVTEFDENCLVALHFADPSSGSFDKYAKNLKDKNVDYDVFAASYYPFWHGSAEGDMYTQLLKIADKYDKKVMVAETSWVTTWEDGDGHSNTSPKTTQTLAYPVSVQGQADEMVDVISNINKINKDYPGKAIGVFYWEPAWISPYYVYNAGSRDESLYNKNKELWEKYGSGWASSYSTEYDPTDAGRWYGGSAVDNQAWFDFNGKALATAKMYSYIRTGASATERRNEIVNVENEIIKQAKVGAEIPWPDENDIVVTFNDGTKSTDKNGNTHLFSAPVIKWDEDQEALVNTDKAGTYTIDGTVVCKYYVIDGDASTIKSETYDIFLTLEVLSTSNILKNAGFEENLALWDTDGTGINDDKNYEEFAKNPRSGKKAMAFWDDEPFNFTIEQTITTIKPGTYTAGGFIEGNGASSKDLQKLYVIVTDSNKKKTKYEATCSLNGWLNWENPEISNIKVSQGDTITVGMEIQSTVAGAWGSIDDMYLYGKYGLNLGDIKNGVVNVSNMEADSGEVVRIAAMPKNGYYLSKLELTGETVTKDILKDESGLGKAAEDATDAKSILIYNDTDDKSDATIQASFVMPEGTVTLNAEFTQVSLTSVSMDNVVAKGFTLKDNKNVCDTTQEYTGKKIELDLDLSYMGYKLTNADYSAKYKNNVNKTTGDNMAEITVTAKGKKFTGKKTLYFNIDDTKVDISKAKAVLTDDDPNKVDTYYYTGAEIEPVITGLTDKNGQPLKNKDGSGNLTVSAEDYKIYYQKNIKVGKATMTVIANNSKDSKIKGSFTQTFTIAKRPIVDNSGNLANGITIVAPTGSTYTGSKITPNVTVKYGNKELQKGRDYTVTYKNNVNVSTGVTDNKKKPSIKITGKGNYTGVTKEYYFEISAKSISDYGMKAEAEAIAENKAPKITLKNGTKKLTLNKHYRITEILRKANGDNAANTIYECDPTTGTVKKGTKPNAAIKEKGEYTVTLSGIEKGGYTGTQTVDFRVIDKEHLISTAKVTKIPKSMPYTGSEVELKEKDIEVKNSKGGTLTYGDDYTLSYNDVNGNKTNIKAGKVTVTITGKGDYAGTKTAKFTIAKRSVEAGKADGTAANKDKAAITYEVKADTLLDKIAKKTAAGSALELPYTGFAWTPELDVYATNAGVKKLLTKGIDYTISYKNNLKPGSEASITIKGKGNYSGSVKFDKVFTVKDVALDDFVITINPVEYSGKALKPAINFVYKETGTVVNMKAGAAYAVKYTNNKNVASIESTTKPTVTITEKGLNAKKKGTAKGKVELPFTITTARITAASVSEVKVQTYNGKPSKPALTIKVNGKKLKAGTDYVVTYSGNSRPNDKATARIIGIGNYSGTVNKTFVIK